MSQLLACSAKPPLEMIRARTETHSEMVIAGSFALESTLHERSASSLNRSLELAKGFGHFALAVYFFSPSSPLVAALLVVGRKVISAIVEQGARNDFKALLCLEKPGELVAGLRIEKSYIKRLQLSSPLEQLIEIAKSAQHDIGAGLTVFANSVSGRI